jgi:ubiquitin-protein ligase
MRILKEISTLQTDGFDPVLRNDSLNSILVKLEGPVDSPFSNGIFDILIELPSDYPSAPPKMTFKTRICHPNIHFHVRFYDIFNIRLVKFVWTF